MTGSIVPDGADCVIRFEDTDEPSCKNGPNLNNPKQVNIFKAAAQGDNIRAAGSIVKKGNLIVPKRTLIGPNHILALASLGIAKIKVVRRPIIAVIPTGDELINPGTPLSLGKVYNSNGPAIMSFINQFGGVPKFIGIARDREASLQAKLDKALSAGADAIVTSGGVSKGDFDLVRLVLAKRGTILFTRVKMGPGASVTFSMIRELPESTQSSRIIPVFSLSGPPAGCFVNMETLLRPALLKMRGLTKLSHPDVKASIADGLRRKAPFSFARLSQLETRNDDYFVNLDLKDIPNAAKR